MKRSIILVTQTDKQEAVCSARGVCFFWEKLTLLEATDFSGEGLGAIVTLTSKTPFFSQNFHEAFLPRVPTRPALSERDRFSIQILPSQARLVWDI